MAVSDGQDQTARSKDRRNTYRLRLIIPTRTNRLPRRRATLEVPEGLRKLQRLNDNPLLLFIVPQLRVSGEREVLAQRMAIKPVVSHNTAQIRMTREEHPEHVIHLTLVPQGALEQPRQARHGRGLVGVGLDADARVEAYAEQVVHDFEPLVLGWVVDGRDIRDLGELGRGVVFQEVHDREESGGGRVKAQLVFPHRELLDVFRQTRHHILSVAVKAFGFVEVFVRWVNHGSTEGGLGYYSQYTSKLFKKYGKGKKSHARGRCAWRGFGRSGVVGGTFAAYCRGVVVKALVQPFEAEANERPEPSRINE